MTEATHQVAVIGAGVALGVAVGMAAERWMYIGIDIAVSRALRWRAQRRAADEAPDDDRAELQKYADRFVNEWDDTHPVKVAYAEAVERGTSEAFIELGRHILGHSFGPASAIYPDGYCEKIGRQLHQMVEQMRAEAAGSAVEAVEGWLSGDAEA